MENRPTSEYDPEIERYIDDHVNGLSAGGVFAFGGDSLATDAALLRYGDPGPDFGKSIARSVAELRRLDSAEGSALDVRFSDI